MPRLYVTGDGHWEASEAAIRAEARRRGTAWKAVDIDTSVRGLIAFLNSDAHLPEVAKVQPASASLEERVELVLDAWTRRGEIDMGALQKHLHDDQRIEVSAHWLGVRLQRRGWGREPFGAIWTPRDEDRPRELTRTGPEHVA